MQELVVVTRFFSGIEDILTTGHWGHSGSPAYYHFIRKLDLREDIDYKFPFGFNILNNCLNANSSFSICSNTFNAKIESNFS